MEIYCIACEKPSKCNLVSGFEIYKNIKFSNKLFYKCNICENYVGTYFDGKPLGTIPTPEIRIWRRNAHQKLDPIWQNGTFKRSYLYRELSKLFGFNFHIALLEKKEDFEKLDIYINQKLKME
jgi:hypothetical protein